MSAEENKAIARRWFAELFNAQNFDVAHEITAQDAVNKQADTSRPLSPKCLEEEASCEVHPRGR